MIRDKRTKHTVRFAGLFHLRLHEHFLHPDLLAKLRHPVRASLVEFVAASATTEPLEQQPATGLAECQRKERFAHKIVRNGGCHGVKVVHFHLDLVAIDLGNVHVP